MIRASRPDDLAIVEALLTRARLPIDGVDEHFASFFVVDEAGRILAAAGVEIHGHDALLRSVVVADEARGSGLGSLLTQRVLEEASARGVRAIYLLTTTAEDFFPRFGFERSARDDVPASLRSSREFQGACPATATVMRRCEQV
jgi:amino-acid N-acetyltransferase